MIILVGVLICATVIHAEPNHADQTLNGEEFSFGPYDAKVDIGVLPDRYPQMSANDEKASSNARRLLELLREYFSTGIHTLPPLDPYISSDLPSHTLNIPLVSGTVDIKLLVINGLQGFRLELLELRLKNLRTDFAVEVPVLTGLVSFRTNLVLSGLIPIDVEGSLRVKLQNVKLEGAISAVANLLPKSYYSIPALHARFHADDVRLIVTGLNLDRSLIDSLQSANLFDSSASLEPAKDFIHSYVAYEALKQFNSIIENFSIQQINSILLAR